MRIRQAQRIIDKQTHRQARYTKGQLKKALRTIWHRSRFADGVDKAHQRMGGGITERTVRAVVYTLIQQATSNED